MEDRIAVSRLKQDDLTGLESLVNRYQAPAVHAAYLIVYDRALAEDIVHTAFMKAAERIHQFEEERAFAPWFFRIVANDALKAAKKQKRVISLDEQLDEPTAQLARWLVDPNAQPEQLLEEKETRQMILGAIQSLPPQQRVTVVMQYFLDMSEVELSTTMDRPVSTIKWWLRDARKRLYELIRLQGGSR